MASRPVYIVGGVRTPFMKSMTKYIDVTSNELMTETLRQLVKRYNLLGKTVEIELAQARVASRHADAVIENTGEVGLAADGRAKA